MPTRLNSAFLRLLWLAFVALLATPSGGDDLTREQIATSVRSAMDLSADPCNDFYRYACGGWLDTTELPGDEQRYARSFSVVRDNNRELIRSLLEEVGADPAGDPARKMIGTYYGSCMDEAAVEARGLAPLHPWLVQLDEVKDAPSFFRAVGKLQSEGSSVLFGAGVTADFKDPSTNVLHLLQGGLGLPDRDYYVSEDEAKRKILVAYEAYVAELLGLIGEAPDVAAQHARGIVALETELARASRTRTEMRNREEMHHRLDRSGLKESTPQLSWDDLFVATGHADIEAINVWTPDFFVRVQELLAFTSPDVLRAYLRFHLLDDHATALPAAFVDASFRFHGRTVGGQREDQPRWKRCVTDTEGALGEVVGQLYVARAFAGSSKDIALSMVGDIETSFENALPQLDWMDDTTRAVAVEKARAVDNRIGYPDAWRDYAGLKIEPGDYFENRLAAQNFDFVHEMAKIGRPVDKTEWGYPPQTVNATYNPGTNQITFPAGILQPPFFHRDFPAAMNYGAIGTVIGHELTHGFDDQGRKFDATGAMREWWAPEVSARFEERVQCVDDQYSAYEVLPGVNVIGRLTLGENVADLGGLKESWAAYQREKERAGAGEPLMPELTDDQLFFVAYSQLWCALATDESARERATTDPHAPPQFRAFGPLTNHSGFHQAFQCAEGTPMHPAKQCTVW